MLEIDQVQENNEILDVFRGMERFSLLSDQEIRSFIHSGELRIYNPGEVLIKQGEYDGRIYFLISGCLDISKDDKLVRRLQRSGDMFGEMGVIDGSPRSASIRAATEVMVLSIDLAYVDHKLKNNEIGACYLIYRLFSEVLAARLRETTEENIQLRRAVAKLGHLE